jgi:LPS export ABC transporter permease LptG
MLGEFLVNQTPQFVYWIVPFAVLIAALVTVALLTKNSELVVMKACGISLYRLTLPMLITAALAAVMLVTIEETVLGPANRRAQMIRHVMNGRNPATFNILQRQWVVGSGGDIYHYDAYDPINHEMHRAAVFSFADAAGGRLARRTYAERIRFIGDATDPAANTWQVEKGWSREFDDTGKPHEQFATFDRVDARLDRIGLFSTEEADPDFMGFRDLRDYTEQLAMTGIDVTEQRVALARKIAFPFVTLVMTLLAVPFAVTIGRSGAMAGIGVGIALAIAYVTMESVFAAFGGGGALAPGLAAWAPNLLFGAGALYLLLTVRT